MTARSYNSWDAYGLSKLALVHFSFEIERRFGKDYNLISTAVHPGSVFTNITRSAIPEETVGVTLSRACSALASLVLFHPKQGSTDRGDVRKQVPVAGGKLLRALQDRRTERSMQAGVGLERVVGPVG